MKKQITIERLTFKVGQKFQASSGAWMISEIKKNKITLFTTGQKNIVSIEELNYFIEAGIFEIIN